MMAFLFGFTIPSKAQCENDEIEKRVDEKIEQFISWVETHPNEKSQVSARFDS